jgi:acetoin:2,6-dichlorophenolindophenol oxidoreductase subunit alpha
MTHTCAESTALLPDQLELFHRMWELRLLDMALEELRIESLINGPVQAAFGQEAVGIGATATLGAGDIAATTRRAHALHVGLGNALGPTIAGMIGATPARAGGAAQAQLLVEHAYAQSLDGEGGVTLCVIEDSDANTICFGEAAAMAASYQRPMVFLVEEIRCGRTSLHRKPASHGMPVVSVDGNDVAVVRDCVASAVQRAREGGGPTLVYAITHRTTDEQFVDPLIFARRRLLAAGVTADRLDEVETMARKKVADAVSCAKAARCG